MSEHKLKVKTHTWNRESSGLFDYENRNNTSSSFKLTESSIVLRSQERVFQISACAELPQEENCKILACFIKNNHNFVFLPANTQQNLESDKPWLTLRRLKDNEYLLSEGDVLRLGKIKLTVKEIKLSRRVDRKRSEIHSKTLQNGGIGKTLMKNEGLARVKTIEDDINKACRICLTDEIEKNNPLISPCYCAGSMGLVHPKCLQRWLDSKITRSFNNSVKVFRWKSLECELCKYKYPEKIDIGNKVIDLVCMDKPKTNYIILENKADGLRNIFLVDFENKDVYKLGRGYDTDIRLPDISVSRNHALISLKPTGFYVKDLSSKFGTLLRIKQQITLDLNSKLEMQCGRTVLQLSVKQPFSLFKCILGCSKGHNSDEELQRYTKDLTEETVHNKV